MLTPTPGCLEEKMKKKYLIILMFLLCVSSLFSKEYIKKYSSSEICSAGVPGNSIYELKIKNKQKKEIQAELFHTITWFSQFISEEIILKLTADGKYEFSFVDAWNNKAFGWVVFNSEEVELYLDCNEFSEEGKNFARLYGETNKLYETTEDKNFINNAIESNYSIKEILNKYDSQYFPINAENKELYINYAGTINNYKIYKTSLLWNINSSKRMTHRLVFIKNEKIAGMYTGIQSDKIRVKNDEIIFEDIEKDNIIKIKNGIPENVFIDGEIFRWENK